MSTEKRFSMGPALLVTAAFVGPGTIYTASKAGAEFGYSLVWAVLFSVIAAIVLQEMAARLGIMSGSGLAESLRTNAPNPIIKVALLILVLGGILFGNIAYQTGNILGAANGLEMISDSHDDSVESQDIASLESEKASSEQWLSPKAIWSIVIAAAALTLIWIGRFDVIQICLGVLVGLMGILFFVSACVCKPDLGQIAAGMIPQVPQTEDAGQFWLLVIGLIGTTVVPYNLFLHASGAATKWSETDDKPTAARHSFWDTVIAVSIGGIITGSLLVTAASLGTKSNGIQDVAEQLRPVLGDWAYVVMAIGLLAAGLTSSITAPIAAAYATAGCFGWEAKLSDVRLKWVATIVVGTGLACAIVLGAGQFNAIIMAQVLNGLLLPIIAGFLLYMVNQSSLMKTMKNGWIANSLGIAIVALTVAMASRQFYLVWLKLAATTTA